MKQLKKLLIQRDSELAPSFPWRAHVSKINLVARCLAFRTSLSPARSEDGRSLSGT